VSHVAHWDDVAGRERHAGDIHATWFDLGSAAGSDRVGLARIRITPGRRSTPAHIHGAEEEIFHVLAGSGLLWQDGETCRVGPGDTIAHVPGGQTHTLRAGDDGLDVLAFGTRVPIELCYQPRAGDAWAGPTVVETHGLRNLFRLDDDAGEFVFPEPGGRFANVAALDDVPAMQSGPPGRVRLDLGSAAGSAHTGLKHVRSDPGKLICVPHCHSAEEELFVVVEGDGVCELGDESFPVRPGSVIGRPAGTGVAHAIRAGESGIAVLAYGTREPSDICYYPRSGKIYIGGLGVIGRIEPVDYWDGEEL
jgi:uncharacterized cupin superfamily protein